MNYINALENQGKTATGLIFDIGGLYDYLMKIPDKRKKRGKQYSLASILVLILLAKMGGEDKPSGITDWVAERGQKMKEWKILAREKTP
jgi:hypothetical protein